MIDSTEIFLDGASQEWVNHVHAQKQDPRQIHLKDMVSVYGSDSNSLEAHLFACHCHDNT